MRVLFEPALGANVVWLTKVDSSNELAVRLMQAMADDEDRLSDTVIVADVQTEGRGREGRRFESPAGGLYATWMGWLSTETLSWLPLAMGAILAEASEALAPVDVRLKWPNDLQVEGRKLGGVLCQSRVAGDQAWALAGFGINLESEPELEASDPVTATCLRAVGWTGTLEAAKSALVHAVTEKLRPTLADPAAVRESWVRRSAHAPGEPMSVRTGAELVVGRFIGFGPEGQLVVEVGGNPRSLAAGELIVPVD